MPRDMFGDVTHPAPGLGARPRSAVSVSLAGHAAFAAIIIIVPLMATDDRPKAPNGEVIVRMAKPPAPPPPASERSGPAKATTDLPPAPRDIAPSEAPDTIVAETRTTSSFGHPAGARAGLGTELIGDAGEMPRAPDLPPAAPQPSSNPVRPGGLIRTPVKVRHVPPVYPAIAQQARVEGIVIIEAVVGVDGRVTEARVLRSKPLLDEAALAAVRQWEFTPTTLNGVPVPVIMTVTVNFTLH